MDRIPELELMTGKEQARAYAAADFEEPHSRFIALLQNRLTELPLAGRALDLGCGPGDIARRFARAYPNWTVDAIDGSAAMLALGRRDTNQAGLASRIRFHEVVLPATSLPNNDYGFVCSNSLLHHLRDPLVLWSSIQNAARGGAAIFVMDLVRPHSRDEARSLVAQYAAEEPEVLRNDFFNSLLAAYQPTEVREQLQAAGLAYLHLEEVSDRHLIVWGEMR